MTDSIVDTTTSEAPAPQQDATVPATQANTEPEVTTDPTGVSQNQEQTPKTFDETYVKGLRNEAAKYRTERTTLAEQVEAAQQEKNELLKNIQKILGGDPADEKSPEDIIAEITAERDKFAEERDTYQTRLAEFRRTEAIRAAAKTASADPDALIDSRTFTDKVKALDTDADDYPAQVAALVSDAVNENPRYKATPAVPTSSGSDPQKSAQPAEAPSGPAAWHAKRFGKK